jgi:hypothetical protein
MHWRKQSGEYRESVIGEVNRYDTYETASHLGDISFMTGTQELTSAVLKQSGFSDHDAHSSLASAASAYAVALTLAQLRNVNMLPKTDLNTIPLDTYIDMYSEMRVRLGIPMNQNQRSEKTDARLLGVARGEDQISEQA